MELLVVLARLLQLLGFARGAAAVWRRHEQRVKAREIADAPSTRAELEKTLKDGNL